MADNDKYYEPTLSEYQGLGGMEPPGTAPPAPRGMFGYLKDTAIDVAKAPFSMIGAAAGVKEAAGAAVDGSSPVRQQALRDMDTVSDVENWLTRQKTETGQYRAEHGGSSFMREPIGALTETATGFLPYLPAAMMGPWGAPVFAAQTVGEQRLQLRQRIHEAAPEDLAKIPAYAHLRGAGKSDEEAKDIIYSQASDPKTMDYWLKALPGIAGAAVGGGAGGLLTKAAMRGVTEDITTNVVRALNQNWMTRMGTEAGKGAVMGGTGELSSEMLEQRAGMRTDLDPLAIAKAGGSAATLFGTLSGVHSVLGPKRTVPPLYLDTAAVARMQQEGYGDPGRTTPVPRSGERQMEQGDVGNFVSPEYGETGPAMKPPTGGVPMQPGDIGVQQEFGPEGATAPRLTGGRRQMRPGDLGPMPSEYGPVLERGERRIGPRPLRSSGEQLRRPMEAGDIGESEYGPAGPAMAPARGGEPMQAPLHAVQEGNVFRAESEYGPVGPREVPRAAAPKAPYTVPELPTERAQPYRPPEPKPREPAVEQDIGPTTPTFPQMGRPRPGVERPHVEGELPYPDRAVVRSMLHSIPAQQRGDIARLLQNMLDRGESPSLARIAGLRYAERAEALVRDHPEQMIREFRRGIEEEPGTQRLSQDQRNAVANVMRHATPEQHEAWAKEMEKTLGSGLRRLQWNTLPKAMRDVLGADREAVVSAVARNAREVIDTVRGREHAPEATRYRSVERSARDHGQDTQAEAGGDVHAKEEGKGEGPQEQDYFAERRSRWRGAEHPEFEGFGPEVEPGERPEPGKGRTARAGDLGLTERGRFRAEIRPKVYDIYGLRTKLVGPRTLKLQNIAERIKERQRQRTPSNRLEVALGEISGPLSERTRQAMAGQGKTLRQAAQERAEAEANKRMEAARAEGERVLQEGIAEQKAREIVAHWLPKLIANAPFMRTMAREEARKAKDRRRKLTRTKEEFGIRDNVAKRVVMDRGSSYGEDALDKIIVGDTTKGGLQEGLARFIDLPKRAMREIAADLRQYALMKVELADEALDELYRNRAAGKKSRQIGYTVSHRRGVGDWYNHLTGYRRFAKTVQNMFNRGEYADLSNTIISFYIREKLAQRGEIEKLTSFNNEELKYLYTQVVDRFRTVSTDPNISAAEKANAKSVLKDVEKYINDAAKPEEKLGTEMEPGEWDAFEALRDLPLYKLTGMDEVQKRSLRLFIENYGIDTEVQAGINALREREYGPREGMDKEDVAKRKAKRPALFRSPRMDMKPEDIGLTYDENGNLRVREQDKVREDRAGWLARPKGYSDYDLNMWRQFGNKWKASAPGEMTPEAMRLTPYERSMAHIYGEKWLGASPETKEQMVTWGPEQPAREGPLLPSKRTMVGRDVDLALQEQLDFVQDGKPLSDEGLQYRIGKLTERAEQINDMLEGLPEGRVPNKIEEQLHTELQAIEHELRRHAEDRTKLGETDYGYGRVLDGAADLRERGALPKGAYVQRVSDYLTPGERNIRPGKDEPGAAMRNHLFDIVDKVGGHLDVVALTPEQTSLAARQRGLPADTPAFYDIHTDRIVISQEALHGSDRARILGHELLHPLTESAVEQFPRIAKRLDDMRKLVLREWTNDNPVVKEALGWDIQGLKNVHEFVSELYNDGGKMAAALHGISTAEVTLTEMRRAWATPLRQNALQNVLTSIKRGLTNLFFNVSKKRLLNDATIASLDLFQSLQKAGRVRPTVGDVEARPFSKEEAVDKAKDIASDLKFKWDRMGGKSGALLNWHDLSELGRRGEAGMQTRVQKVVTAMSHIYTMAKDIMETSGAYKIVQNIANVMRLNTKRFEELQNYIYDENAAGVSGADPLHEGVNKHVGKDDPAHEQMRERHKDLSARWQALSPEAQKLRNDLREFYDKRHKDILESQLQRLISLRDLVPGKNEEQTTALMKHVMREDLSASEKAALEKIPGYESEIDRANKSPEYVKFRTAVAELRRIPQFRKTPGVWYPLMRRGNWVVEGIYNLEKYAKKIAGNSEETGRGQWEFDTAEQAQEFRRLVSGQEHLQGMKHLSSSRVVYEKDPATGGIARDAEGKAKFEMDETPIEREQAVRGEPGAEGYVGRTTVARRRKTANEAKDQPDVVIRHRVTFNPLLLEFYESQRQAHERHAELQGRYGGTKGDDMTLTHVEPKRDPSGNYLNPIHTDQAMRTMLGSLHNSDGWRNLDTTSRAMLERDLNEAAQRTIMATSARSTYIPRRYAMGARKDMMRDFVEYAKNTTMTLAEQRGRNNLHGALKEMDDYVDSHKAWGSEGDPQGKFGTLRRQIQSQLRRRLLERPQELLTPMWNQRLGRVLQVSYMDKLMSPGFWMVNAMEPFMLGAPLLAGHHGFKTYGELLNAYRTIGAGGLWKEGGKDAYRVARAAFKGEAFMPENNVKRLRDRIAGEKDASQLNDLLTDQENHGLLDRDAGMELAQMMDPASGMAGRVLDHMDNSSRQINSQIENVNRGVMAIASYRLGIKDGMGHEQAIAHARKMVHDSAGNYADWNAPMAFKNPYFKFALQFKRYAQRITANYVRMFAGTFGRSENMEPGQRAIAAKQLAFTLGTQVLFAGMLGMPTEPIKAIINGAYALGLSPYNSDDAEAYVRRTVADVVQDPQLAEAITRGVPRAYLDMGIGTRVGHDSIWTYGTLGKTPNDWMTAVAHLALGAPGGYFADTLQGAGQILTGATNFANGYDTEGTANMTEGMAKVIPSKIASDTIMAIADASGAPTTKKYRYDLSGGQAAMQAFGIRPGSVQEAYEKRGTMQRDLRHYQDEQKAWYTQFARADTNAEKQAIWRDIQQNWNPDYPPEMQITYSQLWAAQRRHDVKQDAEPGMVGVQLTRRQRGMLPRYEHYNAGG